MFERPILLWLLLAAPLVAAPGMLAFRTGKRLSPALAVTMRLGCLAALVLMLAGMRIPFRAGAHRMAIVVALDESGSIAPDQRAWMKRQVTGIRRAMSPGDRIAVVGFGRDARLTAPLGDPRLFNDTISGADP